MFPNTKKHKNQSSNYQKSLLNNIEIPEQHIEKVSDFLIDKAARFFPIEEQEKQETKQVLQERNLASFLNKIVTKIPKPSSKFECKDAILKMRTIADNQEKTIQKNMAQQGNYVEEEYDFLDNIENISQYQSAKKCHVQQHQFPEQDKKSLFMKDETTQLQKMVQSQVQQQNLQEQMHFQQQQQQQQQQQMEHSKIKQENSTRIMEEKENYRRIEHKQKSKKVKLEQQQQINISNHNQNQNQNQNSFPINPKQISNMNSQNLNNCYFYNQGNQNTNNGMNEEQKLPLQPILDQFSNTPPTPQKTNTINQHIMSPQFTPKQRPQTVKKNGSNSSQFSSQKQILQRKNKQNSPELINFGEDFFVQQQQNQQQGQQGVNYVSYFEEDDYGKGLFGYDLGGYGDFNNGGNYYGQDNDGFDRYLN